MYLEVSYNTIETLMTEIVIMSHKSYLKSNIFTIANLPKKKYQASSYFSLGCRIHTPTHLHRSKPYATRAHHIYSVHTQRNKYTHEISAMKPIALDGRTGEGGGQLVRLAVALAAITSQPVTITNVRGNRPKDGG